MSDLPLPEAPSPRGTYVPFVRIGDLLFVSGQGPRRGGELVHRGEVGRDLDVGDAVRAAALCAHNVLAQVREACGGDLTAVRRVVKVTGMVRSTSSFTEHTRVVDGASQVFLDVLGDRGRHARTAIGVTSLPSGMPVEVDAIVQLSLLPAPLLLAPGDDDV